MNSELFFRPEAERELIEAVNWYEERIKGLGSSFLLSIEAAIDSISRNPKAYPKIYKNIRRILIRRFPFGIYYFVEKERIIVLAVF
ncbi:MAG: type II toxin-antitoxin system RelE/ParE family toxin, partial [Ignavibacteria bacterium]|nr:type II toxin-antitoxin system RelE/ParE family toxin [Ignavibacteria bacterium]